MTIKGFIKAKEKKQKVIDESKQDDNEGNIYTDARYRAREFIRRQPIYYDINGLWWIWDKELCYWKYLEDDIEVLNLVYSNFPTLDIIQKTIQSQTLSGLKLEGRNLKPKDIKSSWVQFGKTLYDIANGKSFESTPEFFNTNPIFVEVGESEDTPILDKLFKSWVASEDVPKLYEKVAFATIPKMIIHAFDIFYGPPSTGKTTFTNLVADFVGRHNCASTSIERINSNPRFETFRWHKKLLIKLSEVSKADDLRNSAVINNATGEDELAAEKKGGSGFEFMNYGKFFNPTNKLLKVESTDGFGRRVRVIKFMNRFEKEKDVLSEIPEFEWQNLAKKSLRIAAELWKKRQFTGDKKISERMNDYHEMSKTTLEQFVNQFYILEDTDTKCSFAEFFIDYNDFLKKQKLLPVSKPALSKELQDHKGLDLQISKITNIHWIHGLVAKNTSLQQKLQ